MIKLTRFNKIVFFCIVLILCVFTTYRFTSENFTHQFRIIYNLDKKQNDQEIIHIIDNAHAYIYFAIFTFTKENIADALIRAHQRGVIIKGLTDTKQAMNAYEKPIIEKLAQAGIVVETQKHPEGIMHIKAIMTEKEYAVGSYNWTEAATVANDEILEIGTNPYLHAQYLAVIKKLLAANQ